MLRFIIAFLALFLSVSAHAQTKIAVVDMRALLTESQVAKSIQSQIKSRRDSFVSDLSTEEKKLRGMEKTLIEEKGKVSDQDFIDKRQSFEKELIETRKEATDKRRNLEKAAAEASVTLRKEITSVVETIVEENDYDLVLSMQDVVVGSNTLNITDEVMARLNKKMSKIPVKF